MLSHCKTKRAFLFSAILLVLGVGSAAGQSADLTLSQSDIRLEYVYSSGNSIIIGYHLFVREKFGMESVLLTEPEGEYAFRAVEWNAVNGNEIRYLDGKPLTDSGARYSIISSSPVQDRVLGSAFQLFIPETMVYGNQRSQNGESRVTIRYGLEVNIRTFSAKYADYTRGTYQNNAFSLSALPEQDAPEVVPQPPPNSSHTLSPMSSMPYDTDNPFILHGISDKYLRMLIDASHGNVKTLRSKLKVTFSAAEIDDTDLNMTSDAKLQELIDGTNKR